MKEKSNPNLTKRSVSVLALLLELETTETRFTPRTFTFISRTSSCTRKVLIRSYFLHKSDAVQLYLTPQLN